MKSNNNYWRGYDELEKTPEFEAKKGDEFYDGLPLDEVFDNADTFSTNRRDFLKFFGFSVSAVALAACNKTPIKHAMPFVEMPDTVIPGVASHFATSSGAYPQGLAMLAKVREGRPIKLDGNTQYNHTEGGLDAVSQASLLSLYDTNRIQNPGEVRSGSVVDMSWDEVDATIIKQLKAISASGKAISIVTNNTTSLLLDKAIASMNEAYGNVSRVSYENVSYSGMLNANNKAFGKRVIPNYHFDKAETIVSFGADFLGTWLSPVEFMNGWSKNRNPKSGKMSRHIQFESLLSLTGSNADSRVPMKATNEGQHLVKLYNEIAKLSGGAQLNSGKEMDLAGGAIGKAAKDLWKSRGKSIVISGSNDTDIQLIVNGINVALGNYGNTLDMNNYSNASQYDEQAFGKWVKELNAGKVGAAIFIGANPMYSYAAADKIKEGLGKASLVVSTAQTMDETSEAATYITPDNHFLESWDILKPYASTVVTSQPTISPVYNSRQSQSSLMKWAGADVSEKDGYSHAYGLMSSVWGSEIGGDLNKALENGFKTAPVASTPVSFNANLSESVASIGSKKASGLDVVLYQKIGPRDGTFGNTPWAHEVPDPVSKVCWDNYVTMSKYEADKTGLEQGDLVNVTVGKTTINKIPVLIQPGQVAESIGIALGYGRKLPDGVSNDLKDLGKNAYPLAQIGNTTSYAFSGGSIEKVAGKVEFAQTQTHHTIEGRDIVREASMEEYKKNPKVRNEKHIDLTSLWTAHDYSKGHHWGMAIDMSKCTGCSACVVSCSIENNVPVVGRDEIRRRREMHWIRIDRFYSFESPEGYLTKEDEIAAADKSDDNQSMHENVKVIYQPMLCQHCDNAPCETVCPVLATTHSTEGLNQMTYNRCIGTKYCGNNCPYKVRRFNWFRYNSNDKFDYHFNNDLGKMVINPDVTVRSRGVMEKCSFCVQRIQSAKLKAKRENRTLGDNEFTTACAQSCPTGAIVFGDMNDKDSELSKLYTDDRSYHVLEEIDTKPSVVYMTKIRNAKTPVKSTDHHS
jgi:molybdopterin-containing oxidoreductase family iron-sulfur binding subunit